MYVNFPNKKMELEKKIEKDLIDSKDIKKEVKLGRGSFADVYR